MLQLKKLNFWEKLKTMPYSIKYVKYDRRPWKIVDESGNVVGSSTNKSDAEKSIRARLAGEHGWKGTKK